VGIAVVIPFLLRCEEYPQGVFFSLLLPDAQVVAVILVFVSMHKDPKFHKACE
jgi:hypothetical protein